MSTGLECKVIEPKPGEWYYVLQRGDCPVQCWNWMEYAECYGPFKSEDWALRHLRDHHANPGGHERVHNKDYRTNPVLERLIAEAPETTYFNNKLHHYGLKRGEDPYAGIDDPNSDCLEVV